MGVLVIGKACTQKMLTQEHGWVQGLSNALYCDLRPES